MSRPRAITFAALAGFALLHWMAMVDPAEPLRAAAALAVALLAGARPVLAIVAVPAALVAGGVDPASLWPGRWDELAVAIGAGLENVSSVQLPYRGSDVDVRLVLGLGGALLAVSAGLVAARHRVGGLIVLGFTYAVPATTIGFDGEFARGALFAVLVLAYVCADRLSARDLGPATGFAIAGSVVALAAAPALDGDEPWFDYEAFAQQQTDEKSTRFSWEHDYSALVWPRDGRELLEVAAPRSTYWKAETLDEFDRARWVRNPTAGAPIGGQNVGVDPANIERWSFDIAVSVRGLKSEMMPLAAVAEDVRMEGLTPNLEASGVWHAGRDLERGDSYSARVYVPEPSRAELRAAESRYPGSIVESLTFDVPRAGDSDATLIVREFAGPPETDYFDTGIARSTLAASKLSRVWGLSRELLAGAETPYDYVRAVGDHLRGGGYVYDEAPPRGSSTLDGFLFETRAGFCQHYSGAMALLLRMGGVPARVATGFAPGSFDKGSDRYVVRDVDAHSWVEAWFGGIGWVVFDPTPAAAPPRSQALASAVSAALGDSRDIGTTQGVLAPEEPDRGPLLALALVLLLAGAAAAWSQRPGRLQGTELERALRGAGLVLPAGTTLSALEHGLAPAAHQYLRALRKERYAGGEGPSARDRRELRRALAAGRGPIARARVWHALPPQRSRKHL